LTKIFHPNVATPSGEICVNTLKRDWDPSKWNLSHIFSIIKCLLIVPFPESALNEEAGRLFMESYNEFSSQAKLFT
jgi:ubiquitin-conjugating enzyme E2 S